MMKKKDSLGKRIEKEAKRLRKVKFRQDRLEKILDR